MVHGETVIDPGRQNDQVARFYENADPIVREVPHVEVATAFNDESDFFVGVQVFLEEDFDL